MYIPKYYKVTDVHEIEAFIQMNSFATLVTTKQGTPIATHLPLMLHKKGEDTYLTGHMAYGNPQWRTFASCGDVLVMFQAPCVYFFFLVFARKCANVELSGGPYLWHSNTFR
ncbi:Protease synthase and sporulation protein PAI 2 [Lysinibacillus sphaericus]